jgi:hypothetical protein
MVADAMDKREALRADIQQGINSGPGRPVQQVTADLHPLPAMGREGRTR